DLVHAARVLVVVREAETGYAPPAVAQARVQPPSAESSAPVTNDEASEAGKWAASAVSPPAGHIEEITNGPARDRAPTAP
ncbi:hypothetical protein ACFWFQ_17110, partial [Nocardia salmonicida]|uniref:hypothetical protein n=1 Tax=Nocardia salmonicida TaxID=53431 RepID=UPI003652FA2E